MSDLPQITICDCVTERTGVPHVFIPRVQYKALMMAVPALVRAQRTLNTSDTWAEGETDKMCQRALAALRAAGLEVALGGKEIPDWKKPLYEDGKTPDKKAIDEAAAEFRRTNIALSGKEEK